MTLIGVTALRSIRNREMRAFALAQCIEETNARWRAERGRMRNSVTEYDALIATTLGELIYSVMK